ncbi:MAG: hypothetical protein ACK5LZ_04715, partial [Anaerorhabdus sp.]
TRKLIEMAQGNGVIIPNEAAWIEGVIANMAPYQSEIEEVRGMSLEAINQEYHSEDGEVFREMFDRLEGYLSTIE